MNQLSSISFGNDATVLRGYAQATNERLGYVQFLIENTGNIPLVFQLRQYDGTTSPSGYANIGAQQTVNARGSKNVSYNLLSKRVGFFGSGVPANVTINGVTTYVTSTTANISVSWANKAQLDGRQIDLVATGRRGWTYDDAFARPELKKKWGTMSTGGAYAGNSGQIDATTEGV